MSNLDGFCLGSVGLLHCAKVRGTVSAQQAFFSAQADVVLVMKLPPDGNGELRFHIGLGHELMISEPPDAPPTACAVGLQFHHAQPESTDLSTRDTVPGLELQRGCDV